MKTCLALFPVLGLLICNTHIRSQSQSKVVVEFQLDGKRQPAPSFIEFIDADGTIRNESIVGDAFNVPRNLKSPVTVRLRFLDRTLLFSEVYPSKFEGKWVIGIDEPPFDPENFSSRYRKEKLKELWYIGFEPSKGDGTRIVVAIPMGNNSSGK